MARFDIQPLTRFATGSSASIRRPKEIACFSYDDAHHFHLDERSLRYYYPPRIGTNLSNGFDTFEQLDDSADDHLDSLLKTIVHVEQRTRTKCQADIITWRGMMTKIMATPFDLFSGYEMNVTRFQWAGPQLLATEGNLYMLTSDPKGTIFIEENHAYKLESRQAQRNQSIPPGNASQDLMSYWGYKFETLSLLPSPWAETSRDYIESREDRIVSNSAQYCSVVKTGIGKSKLILGGEVDALWDAKPPDPSSPINWVELKTAATPLSDKDVFKYERKLLKFWIQSFLLGVPKIIVGFRSKEGVLQSLEELETAQIPRLVKAKGKGSWDGNVCINYTAAFLEWLCAVIAEDGGIWRIRKREKVPVVEIFKVEESGYGDILLENFVKLRNREDRDLQ